MKKICSKCGKVKPFDSYYPDNRIIDGKQSQCKKCMLKTKKRFNQTKPGVVARIYASQKTHSVERDYALPIYTVSELKVWLYSQPLFHQLYDSWVESDFDIKLKPSIDRIDDYKSYDFNNIKLMTWDENRAKAHKHIKNGKNNKQSKAILQFGLNGVFISEYYSTHNAERKTGVNQGSIIKCCKKKQIKCKNGKSYPCRTAGGFIWKYKY